MSRVLAPRFVVRQRMSSRADCRQCTTGTYCWSFAAMSAAPTEPAAPMQAAKMLPAQPRRATFSISLVCARCLGAPLFRPVRNPSQKAVPSATDDAPRRTGNTQTTHWTSETPGLVCEVLAETAPAHAEMARPAAMKAIANNRRSRSLAVRNTTHPLAS